MLSRFQVQPAQFRHFKSDRVSRALLACNGGVYGPPIARSEHMRPGAKRSSNALIEHRNSPKTASHFRSDALSRECDTMVATVNADALLALHDKLLRDRSLLRGWLYLVLLVLFALVIVGGATRLTDSG